MFPHLRSRLRFGQHRSQFYNAEGETEKEALMNGYTVCSRLHFLNISSYAIVTKFQGQKGTQNIYLIVHQNLHAKHKYGSYKSHRQELLARDAIKRTAKMTSNNRTFLQKDVLQKIDHG